MWKDKNANILEWLVVSEKRGEICVLGTSDLKMFKVIGDCLMLFLHNDLLPKIGWL